MIDFARLASFSVIVFMLIEILKVLLVKLKPAVTRIICYVLLAGASAALAAVVPVYKFLKLSWLYNMIIYTITEYFIYLVVKEEMKLSIRDLIIQKLGISKTVVTTTTTTTTQKK